jgi:hypothetical protein
VGLDAEEVRKSRNNDYPEKKKHSFLCAAGAGRAGEALRDGKRCERIAFSGDGLQPV